MSDIKPFSTEYSLKIAGESAIESGCCTIIIAGSGVELIPHGAASIPIRFAEISSWKSDDCCFSMILADSTEICIKKLARRYDEFVGGFRKIRQEHFLKVLLLEEGERAAIDGGECERRDASGALLSSGPCCVHLQRTSLACFPDTELPYLVPYGAITGMERDDVIYGVRITCDFGEELSLCRFGKRTDELFSGLESRRAALAKRQSDAIAALAPNSGAMMIRRAAALLRDGAPAGHEQLNEASPGVWDALWQFGFCEERRQYAEWLLEIAERSFVVIKETGPWGAGENTPAALEDRWLLYLFHVNDALVIETPSSDDAATYIFRSKGDVENFVRTLCRALAAVQYRREPLYLPAAALNTPPNDRYSEAARILPSLVATRKELIGRVIHNSFDVWKREIQKSVGSK